MEIVVGLTAMLFGLLVFCGLAVGYVVGIMSWTLGPLMQAARNKPSPTSFLISDLLWLMVHLQFAMGLVAWAIPTDVPAENRVLAVVFMGLPMIGFWYGCLHAVSQAGIERPLCRAVAFVVLFPGAVLALVALPALLLSCLSLLGQSEDSPGRAEELSMAAFQLALVTIATAALRPLATWTVRRGTKSPATGRNRVSAG
jgi:hypothetical protein